MYGVIEKKGVRISTLKEWRDHAPPKNKIHWKDGRSAKESAKSWLAAAPLIPDEIADTLSSHHDIGTLCDWRAEPEARVRFDKFRGQPSNIDVLLTGRDETGPIVVVVEAKADESFGQTVEKTLSAARLRLKPSLAAIRSYGGIARPVPPSKGVERIERLLAALFGATTDQPDILNLRYQLLTVTAAAMAEAERQSAQRAVVMIHEFITCCTTDTKHDSNARDLDQFVTRISGRQDPLKSGTLLGPFKVPGKPIVETEISLYFGKAVENKR